MLIGYNTNGFGFHALDDAIRVIADAGYSCVALTPDVHHLNPFTASRADVARIGTLVGRLGLSVVIEAGARFVLDAGRKHRPTLLDEDPWPRIQFLRACFGLAESLGAGIVSAWSGARPEPGGESDDGLYARLAWHWDRLHAEAGARGLKLAIEPEPGFLVERMADYSRLAGLLGYRPHLTVDVGHVVCVGDGGDGPVGAAPARVIREFRDSLVNVQLDDMKPGEHAHLPLGRGVVDFGAVFGALREIGFAGPVCVELSDASRNAVVVCRETMTAIRGLIGSR
jgi:sugar phosphate isomerase/epimerase